ncbi:uncharacterized protein LACBIDRAFT_329543 [Laccaria bicolor S238N-H82]|uniref:Predicted protein n=1 Tax=Laccaria bicolor (strain S238N-H82 / ATCC MYA-4686) TaxID=486041 RepID=B0DID3_LACBS|nr:uncharacterized protein LACBIDRAFT_329543 [Laccaria bicolor S238N-H82]EDR05670.1 predicted protein [Laccaria bicolor S238N-H82]|eukprot:XP_001883774.1 predicted protein [Laccaria bicolor S238N-H82]
MPWIFSRRLNLPSSGSHGGGDPFASPIKSFFNMGGGKRGDMTEEIDEVDLAVWWVPASDATQGMYLRRLEGEIHLAKDLQPTCRFLPFSVEYAIEMLPLVSQSFEPYSTGREKFILIHPVEIATHHSEEGPMPTAFTKPFPDREREKREKDREKEKEHMPEPHPIKPEREEDGLMTSCGQLVRCQTQIIDVGDSDSYNGTVTGVKPDNTAGHQLSPEHSLNAESPNRFPHRTTAPLNRVGTRLPRYSALGSQQSISDYDVEPYADGETIDPRSTTDDGITAPPVEDASSQNRLSARESVGSASPPRYSFAPPRYSSAFGVSAQQVTTGRAEHIYNICSGLKNKPWVTFRVFSQPSPGASSKHQDLPRFSSGDIVAGLIEFTLDSPQTINSITVSLRGRVIRGYLAEESDTFLDHQVSIWTRADGDPHFPDQGSTKKFNGRLNGAHHFPFAFPFPTLVDISTSTAFPPPFQTLQDPVGSSPNPSSSNATVSPTRSSSLLPATTPPTRFRSRSIPTNATFFSDEYKRPL